MASVFSRAQRPSPKPAAPKKPARTGLRALVPTAYRADGESNEFLRSYKTKWLSKIDFASESHVESLLLLSFMVLALGRESEAEFVAATLLRHVDYKRASPATRQNLVTAMYVTAWLKTKHGKDAQRLVEHARLLGRAWVHRDRGWLSEEAPMEIHEALERRKMSDLVGTFAGIAYWLNDAGARLKAESVLESALDVLRSMMK